MGEAKRVKKPQPPKFGKLERIVVLILVGVTVATSAYLGLEARGGPTISKPDFSSTIVLEAAKPKVDPLPKLQEILKNLKGEYGIYVIDTKTGDKYGLSENEKFEGASLFKLPVMIAAYKEHEAGNLDLEKYKPLLRSMGKHSDNSAFLTLTKVIGMTKINQVITHIGMTNTSFSTSTTTPRDMALLFQKLQKGELISDSSKTELLSFLTDTDFEYLIAKGVPENIDVAHKYGRETEVFNDAGIVFTPDPYIVVILSQEVTELEAKESFPKLSEIIYELQK